MSQLSVTAFFDETTFTVTYVAADPGSAQAAIIDPVLDFDPASGRTSTASADKVVDFVRTNDLSVGWILETHVHADHLTAAPYLKEKLGGRIAIGKNVAAVQDTFKSVFNIEDLATDGTQFDHLFEDGDEFRVGSIAGSIIGTPGHTPACITYVVGDAAFVGDTLFMPDFGTARTDFPGGDAGDL
jgi:glyoxylase-like metal-dependent hydrolase (beta-lactamase superfamily II)